MSGPFDKRPGIRRLGTEPDSVPTPIDDEHTHRLRNLEDKMLVLAGVGGDNGRLGNLAKKVDSHGSLLKAVGCAALSGVVGAALALYQAGQRSGAREQEIQFLRAEVAAARSEVRDLRASTPVYPRYAPRSAPGDVP